MSKSQPLRDHPKDVRATDTVVTTIVRRLVIERFRGLENFSWNPDQSLNIIIGGGDVGKTTILDALGMLFSASSNLTLTESDYWQRKAEDGFVIKAVVSLAPDSGISQQSKFSWPWEWNGTDAVLPEKSGTATTPQTPVYRIQLKGTPEFEPVWEIHQPDEEFDAFPASVRKSIGTVRLGGDDRNDRDLRLVYGSALDRLLADKALRSRLGKAFGSVDFDDALQPEAKQALAALDKAFSTASLPEGLRLGLSSSQGVSLGALTGLFANKSPEVSLPLSSWGSGTRRMAALEIARASEATSRITIIDEAERGLEPYRLRRLIRALEDSGGQSFVTTHSPIALGTTKKAAIWYFGGQQSPGLLNHEKLDAHAQTDPEAFLSRFPIICEGITEVGFLDALLNVCAKSYIDHGVHLSDAGGNGKALDISQALTKAGVSAGAFADNEGTSLGKWTTLKTEMGDRLFQWREGCLESNIIKLISDEQISAFIQHGDRHIEGQRYRTLRDRLRCEEKDLDSLKLAANAAGIDLRDVICAAAMGKTDGAQEGENREWKSHSRRWFKNEKGGGELHDKCVALGLMPSLWPVLRPLINAIRHVMGHPPMAESWR